MTFRGDHFLTNLIGRLRGWPPARLSLTVEARDENGPFFCTYDSRFADVSQAEQALTKMLHADGAELVQIDDVGRGRVPIPPGIDTVRVIGRIYFPDDDGREPTLEDS